MNTTGDTTRESSPEAALDSDTIRDAVREHYARLIDTGTDGCCTPRCRHDRGDPDSELL